MDIYTDLSLQSRKKHLSDGFIVGAPPKTPPRCKRRDSRAITSARVFATEDNRNDAVPQVRNHRRSSVVRIEVDEHIRRRSLPDGSTQSESALFQGRLEAFLETCVELVVHDEIAKVVTKHVGSVLKESIAQIESCRKDLAQLEEDLAELRSCRCDLEKEKARFFQRTTGGSISDLACVEERTSSDHSVKPKQSQQDSRQRTLSNDHRAAQNCPLQNAAVSVVSTLNSVFYRSPQSAFNGPHESPLDESPAMPPCELGNTSSDPVRFTDGSSQSHQSIDCSDEDFLSRKARLMQRHLGEHLFLPGVQIDKHATIEQALADARFMNQLLPSHAMEHQDPADMIAPLMRLIAEVEVDIRALHKESKLKLSNLEQKVLRISACHSWKLKKSLKGFVSKLQERQNAAWIGLIETASMGTGSSPTAALQSTLCPASIRCAAATAQPPTPKEDSTRLRRPSIYRQRSDSMMAVCDLENMSL